MNLLNGLIHEWKFNETSGTTAVDSVGSINLSGVGTPTWTTGLINNSVVLADSKRLVASSNILNLNNFTISVWVYPTSTEDQILFSSASSNFWGGLRINSNGIGRVDISVNGWGTNIVTNTAYTSTNKWHFFALKKSGNNYKVYHNGNYLGGLTNTSTFNTGNFVIGYPNTFTSLSVVGRVDQTLIWNRDLSDNEIKYLYEIQRNGSLLGQYPFNTSGNSFGGGI
jgi:hypothetical protein